MLGAGRAVVRRSTVTVEVHDIGQNPLYSMPEGRGFPVIDLAVQVSPEKVVAGILEHEPDIVGFSAFMPMFKADINVLQKGGPARPGDRSWWAAPPPSSRRTPMPAAPTATRPTSRSNGGVP
jgi:hypothetical protein